MFLIRMPGLAMIFSVPFIFYKTDYGCVDGNYVLDRISNVSSNISNEVQEPLYQNLTLPTVKGKFQNSCEIKCNKFSYDRSFWQQSVIMEWDLVCDHNYLSVLGKMTIFGGFAIGTFGAGWLSDSYGRKTTIILL